MDSIWQTFRKVVFNLLLTVVLLCAVSIFFLNYYVGFNTSTDGEEISRQLQTAPIVSIYVPPLYQGNRCLENFEPVYIDGALKSKNENALPEIKSKSWRGSTVCIKRGGKASVTYDMTKSSQDEYEGRPTPDDHGNCPDGFKKCGDGFDQKEAAICFPLFAECPITGLLLLPANGTLPAHEFWESAGTFPHHNHTLYFRRQFVHERPILDATFRLTESDAVGHNVRGVCYKGPTQVIINSIVSDSTTTLPSYSIVLPPVCNVTDHRYILLDQVPLLDHFVENLLLTKPTCRMEENATSECTQYTNAVRAVFVESTHLTLGMFYTREVEWTEKCKVEKVDLYWGENRKGMSWMLLSVAFLAGIVYHLLVTQDNAEEFRYLYDYVGFTIVFLIIAGHLVFMLTITSVYDKAASADCSDALTRDTLQQVMEPSVAIVMLEFVMLTILGLLITESYIQSGLTLQHSRLTFTRVRDEDGRTRVIYYLEPLPAVTAPTNSEHVTVSTSIVNCTGAGIGTTLTGLQRRANRHSGY